MRALRAAGIAASVIIGKLAHGLGITADDGARTAIEAVRQWKETEHAWPREPWRVPEEEWAEIGGG